LVRKDFRDKPSAVGVLDEPAAAPTFAGARGSRPDAPETVIKSYSDRQACEWKKYQGIRKISDLARVKERLMELARASEQPPILPSVSAERVRNMGTGKSEIAVVLIDPRNDGVA
jgi:hypothetical protein